MPTFWMNVGVNYEELQLLPEKVDEVAAAVGAEGEETLLTLPADITFSREQIVEILREKMSGVETELGVKVDKIDAGGAVKELSAQLESVLSQVMSQFGAGGALKRANGPEIAGLAQRFLNDQDEYQADQASRRLWAQLQDRVDRELAEAKAEGKRGRTDYHFRAGELNQMSPADRQAAQGINTYLNTRDQVDKTGYAFSGPVTTRSEFIRAAKEYNDYSRGVDESYGRSRQHLSIAAANAGLLSPEAAKGASDAQLRAIAESASREMSQGLVTALQKMKVLLSSLRDQAPKPSGEGHGDGHGSTSVASDNTTVSTDSTSVSTQSATVTTGEADLTATSANVHLNEATVTAQSLIIRGPVTVQGEGGTGGGGAAPAPPQAAPQNAPMMDLSQHPLGALIQDQMGKWAHLSGLVDEYEAKLRQPGVDGQNAGNLESLRSDALSRMEEHAANVRLMELGVRVPDDHSDQRMPLADKTRLLEHLYRQAGLTPPANPNAFDYNPLVQASDAGQPVLVNRPVVNPNTYERPLFMGAMTVGGSPVEVKYGASQSHDARGSQPTPPPSRPSQPSHPSSSTFSDGTPIEEPPPAGEEEGFTTTPPSATPGSAPRSDPRWREGRPTWIVRNDERGEGAKPLGPGVPVQNGPNALPGFGFPLGSDYQSYQIDSDRILQVPGELGAPLDWDALRQPERPEDDDWLRGRKRAYQRLLAASPTGSHADVIADPDLFLRTLHKVLVGSAEEGGLGYDAVVGSMGKNGEHGQHGWVLNPNALVPTGQPVGVAPFDAATKDRAIERVKEYENNRSFALAAETAEDRVRQGRERRQSAASPQEKDAYIQTVQNTISTLEERKAKLLERLNGRKTRPGEGDLEERDHQSYDAQQQVAEGEDFQGNTVTADAFGQGGAGGREERERQAQAEREAFGEETAEEAQGDKQRAKNATQGAADVIGRTEDGEEIFGHGIVGLDENDNPIFASDLTDGADLEQELAAEYAQKTGKDPYAKAGTDKQAPVKTKAFQKWLPHARSARTRKMNKAKRRLEEFLTGRAARTMATPAGETAGAPTPAPVAAEPELTDKERAALEAEVQRIEAEQRKLQEHAENVNASGEVPAMEVQKDYIRPQVAIQAQIDAYDEQIVGAKKHLAGLRAGTSGVLNGRLLDLTGGQGTEAEQFHNDALYQSLMGAATFWDSESGRPVLDKDYERLSETEPDPKHTFHELTGEYFADSDEHDAAIKKFWANVDAAIKGEDGATLEDAWKALDEAGRVSIARATPNLKGGSKLHKEYTEGATSKGLLQNLLDQGVVGFQFGGETPLMVSQVMEAKDAAAVRDAEEAVRVLEANRQDQVGRLAQADEAERQRSRTGVEYRAVQTRTPAGKRMLDLNTTAGDDAVRKALANAFRSQPEQYDRYLGQWKREWPALGGMAAFQNLMHSPDMSEAQRRMLAQNWFIGQGSQYAGVWASGYNGHFFNGTDPVPRAGINDPRPSLNLLENEGDRNHFWKAVQQSLGDKYEGVKSNYDQVAGVQGEDAALRDLIHQSMTLEQRSDFLQRLQGYSGVKGPEGGHIPFDAAIAEHWAGRPLDALVATPEEAEANIARAIEELGTRTREWAPFQDKDYLELQSAEGLETLERMLANSLSGDRKRERAASLRKSFVADVGEDGRLVMRQGDAQANWRGLLNKLNKDERIAFQQNFGKRFARVTRNGYHVAWDNRAHAAFDALNKARDYKDALTRAAQKAHGPSWGEEDPFGPDTEDDINERMLQKWLEEQPDVAELNRLNEAGREHGLFVEDAGTDAEGQPRKHARIIMGGEEKEFSVENLMRLDRNQALFALNGFVDPRTKKVKVWDTMNRLGGEQRATIFEFLNKIFPKGAKRPGQFDDAERVKVSFKNPNAPPALKVSYPSGGGFSLPGPQWVDGVVDPYLLKLSGSDVNRLANTRFSQLTPEQQRIVTKVFQLDPQWQQQKLNQAQQVAYLQQVASDDVVRNLAGNGRRVGEQGEVFTHKILDQGARPAGAATQSLGVLARDAATGEGILVGSLEDLLELLKQKTVWAKQAAQAQRELGTSAKDAAKGEAALVQVLERLMGRGGIHLNLNGDNVTVAPAAGRSASTGGGQGGFARVDGAAQNGGVASGALGADAGTAQPGQRSTAGGDAGRPDGGAIPMPPPPSVSTVPGQFAMGEESRDRMIADRRAPSNLSEALHWFTPMALRNLERTFGEAGANSRLYGGGMVDRKGARYHGLAADELPGLVAQYLKDHPYHTGQITSDNLTTAMAGYTPNVGRAEAGIGSIDEVLAPVRLAAAMDAIQGPRREPWETEAPEGPERPRLSGKSILGYAYRKSGEQGLYSPYFNNTGQPMGVATLVPQNVLRNQLHRTMLQAILAEEAGVRVERETPDGQVRLNLSDLTETMESGQGGKLDPVMHGRTFSGKMFPDPGSAITAARTLSDLFGEATRQRDEERRTRLTGASKTNWNALRDAFVTHAGESSETIRRTLAGTARMTMGQMTARIREVHENDAMREEVLKRTGLSADDMGRLVNAQELSDDDLSGLLAGSSAGSQYGGDLAGMVRKRMGADAVLDPAAYRQNLRATLLSDYNEWQGLFPGPEIADREIAIVDRARGLRELRGQRRAAQKKLNGLLEQQAGASNEAYAAQFDEAIAGQRAEITGIEGQIGEFNGFIGREKREIAGVREELRAKRRQFLKDPEHAEFRAAKGQIEQPFFAPNKSQIIRQVTGSDTARAAQLSRMADTHAWLGELQGDLLEGRGGTLPIPADAQEIIPRFPELLAGIEALNAGTGDAGHLAKMVADRRREMVLDTPELERITNPAGEKVHFLTGGDEAEGAKLQAAYNAYSDVMRRIQAHRRAGNDPEALARLERLRSQKLRENPLLRQMAGVGPLTRPMTEERLSSWANDTAMERFNSFVRSFGTFFDPAAISRPGAGIVLGANDEAVLANINLGANPVELGNLNPAASDYDDKIAGAQTLSANLLSRRLMEEIRSGAFGGRPDSKVDTAGLQSAVEAWAQDVARATQPGALGNVSGAALDQSQRSAFREQIAHLLPLLPAAQRTAMAAAAGEEKNPVLSRIFGASTMPLTDDDHSGVYRRFASRFTAGQTPDLSDFFNIPDLLAPVRGDDPLEVRLAKAAAQNSRRKTGRLPGSTRMDYGKMEQVVAQALLARGLDPQEAIPQTTALGTSLYKKEVASHFDQQGYMRTIRRIIENGMDGRDLPDAAIRASLGKYDTLAAEIPKIENLTPTSLHYRAKAMLRDLSAFIGGPQKEAADLAFAAHTTGDWTARNEADVNHELTNVLGGFNERGFLNVAEARVVTAARNASGPAASQAVLARWAALQNDVKGQGLAASDVKARVQAMLRDVQPHLSDGGASRLEDYLIEAFNKNLKGAGLPAHEIEAIRQAVYSQALMGSKADSQNIAYGPWLSGFFEELEKAKPGWTSLVLGPEDSPSRSILLRDAAQQLLPPDRKFLQSDVSAEVLPAAKDTRTRNRFHNVLRTLFGSKLSVNQGAFHDPFEDERAYNPAADHGGDPLVAAAQRAIRDEVEARNAAARKEWGAGREQNPDLPEPEELRITKDMFRKASTRWRRERITDQVLAQYTDPTAQQAYVESLAAQQGLQWRTEFDRGNNRNEWFLLHPEEQTYLPAANEELFNAVSERMARYLRIGEPTLTAAERAGAYAESLGLTLPSDQTSGRGRAYANQAGQTTLAAGDTRSYERNERRVFDWLFGRLPKLRGQKPLEGILFEDVHGGDGADHTKNKGYSVPTTSPMYSKGEDSWKLPAAQSLYEKVFSTDLARTIMPFLTPDQVGPRRTKMGGVFNMLWDLVGSGTKNPIRYTDQFKGSIPGKDAETKRWVQDGEGRLVRTDTEGRQWEFKNGGEELLPDMRVQSGWQVYNMADIAGQGGNELVLPPEFNAVVRSGKNNIEHVFRPGVRDKWFANAAEASKWLSGLVRPFSTVNFKGDSTEHRPVAEQIFDALMADDKKASPDEIEARRKAAEQLMQRTLEVTDILDRTVLHPADEAKMLERFRQELRGYQGLAGKTDFLGQLFAGSKRRGGVAGVLQTPEAEWIGGRAFGTKDKYAGMTPEFTESFHAFLKGQYRPLSGLTQAEALSEVARRAVESGEFTPDKAFTIQEGQAASERWVVKNDPRIRKAMEDAGYAYDAPAAGTSWADTAQRMVREGAIAPFDTEGMRPDALATELIQRGLVNPVEVAAGWGTHISLQSSPQQGEAYVGHLTSQALAAAKAAGRAKQRAAYKADDFRAQAAAIRQAAEVAPDNDLARKDGVGRYLLTNPQLDRELEIARNSFVAPDAKIQEWIAAAARIGNYKAAVDRQGERKAKRSGILQQGDEQYLSFFDGLDTRQISGWIQNKKRELDPAVRAGLDAQNQKRIDLVQAEKARRAAEMNLGRAIELEGNADKLAAEEQRTAQALVEAVTAMRNAGKTLGIGNDRMARVELAMHAIQTPIAPSSRPTVAAVPAVAAEATPESGPGPSLSPTVPPVAIAVPVPVPISAPASVPATVQEPEREPAGAGGQMSPVDPPVTVAVPASEPGPTPKRAPASERASTPPPGDDRAERRRQVLAEIEQQIAALETENQTAAPGRQGAIAEHLSQLKERRRLVKAGNPPDAPTREGGLTWADIQRGMTVQHPSYGQMRVTGFNLDEENGGAGASMHLANANRVVTNFDNPGVLVKPMGEDIALDPFNTNVPATLFPGIHTRDLTVKRAELQRMMQMLGGTMHAERMRRAEPDLWGRVQDYRLNYRRVQRMLAMLDAELGNRADFGEEAMVAAGAPIGGNRDLFLKEGAEISPADVYGYGTGVWDMLTDATEGYSSRTGESQRIPSTNNRNVLRGFFDAQARRIAGIFVPRNKRRSAAAGPEIPKFDPNKLNTDRYQQYIRETYDGAQMPAFPEGFEGLTISGLVDKMAGIDRAIAATGKRQDISPRQKADKIDELARQALEVVTALRMISENPHVRQVLADLAAAGHKKAENLQNGIARVLGEGFNDGAAAAYAEHLRGPLTADARTAEDQYPLQGGPENQQPGGPMAEGARTVNEPDGWSYKYDKRGRLAKRIYNGEDGEGRKVRQEFNATDLRDVRPGAWFASGDDAVRKIQALSNQVGDVQLAVQQRRMGALEGARQIATLRNKGATIGQQLLALMGMDGSKEALEAEFQQLAGGVEEGKALQAQVAQLAAEQVPLAQQAHGDYQGERARARAGSGQVGGYLMERLRGWFQFFVAQQAYFWLQGKAMEGFQQGAEAEKQLDVFGQYGGYNAFGGDAIGKREQGRILHAAQKMSVDWGENINDMIRLQGLWFKQTDQGASTFARLAAAIHLANQTAMTMRATGMTSADAFGSLDAVTRNFGFQLKDIGRISDTVVTVAKMAGGAMGTVKVGASDQEAGRSSQDAREPSNFAAGLLRGLAHASQAGAKRGMNVNDLAAMIAVVAESAGVEPDQAAAGISRALNNFDRTRVAGLMDKSHTQMSGNVLDDLAMLQKTRPEVLAQMNQQPQGINWLQVAAQHVPEIQRISAQAGPGSEGATGRTAIGLMDNYQAQTQRAMAAFQGMVAQVGVQMLPNLTRFMNTLANGILPNMDNWANRLGTILKLLMNMAPAIAILGLMNKTWASGASFLSTLKDNIAGYRTKMVEATGAAGAMNVAMFEGATAAEAEAAALTTMQRVAITTGAAMRGLGATLMGLMASLGPILLLAGALKVLKGAMDFSKNPKGAVADRLKETEEDVLAGKTGFWAGTGRTLERMMDPTRTIGQDAQYGILNENDANQTGRARDAFMFRAMTESHFINPEEYKKWMVAHGDVVRLSGLRKQRPLTGEEESRLAEAQNQMDSLHEKAKTGKVSALDVGDQMAKTQKEIDAILARTQKAYPDESTEPVNPEESFQRAADMMARQLDAITSQMRVFERALITASEALGEMEHHSRMLDIRYKGTNFSEAQANHIVSALRSEQTGLTREKVAGAIYLEGAEAELKAAQDLQVPDVFAGGRAAEVKGKTFQNSAPVAPARSAKQLGADVNAAYADVDRPVSGEAQQRYADDKTPVLVNTWRSWYFEQDPVKRSRIWQANPWLRNVTGQAERNATADVSSGAVRSRGQLAWYDPQQGQIMGAPPREVEEAAQASLRSYALRNSVTDTQAARRAHADRLRARTEADKAAAAKAQQNRRLYGTNKVAPRPGPAEVTPVSVFTGAPTVQALAEAIGGTQAFPAESGGNYGAMNPRSSATGRYQFTAGTALQYMTKTEAEAFHGKDQAPWTNNPNDPYRLSFANSPQLQDRIFGDFARKMLTRYQNSTDQIGSVIAAHRGGQGFGDAWVNLKDASEAALKAAGFTMDMVRAVKARTEYFNTHAGTGWLFPLQGQTLAQTKIKHGFGAERIGAPGIHDAVDLPAPEGTPVVASRGGKVVMVEGDWQQGQKGHNARLGNFALIQSEDGKYQRYSHMEKGSVSLVQGAEVIAGQPIGRVGQTGAATGPHLDFAVLDKNRRPENPLPYLQYAAAGDQGQQTADMYKRQADLNRQKQEAITKAMQDIQKARMDQLQRDERIEEKEYQIFETLHRKRMFLLDEELRKLGERSTAWEKQAKFFEAMGERLQSTERHFGVTPQTFAARRNLVAQQVEPVRALASDYRDVAARISPRRDRMMALRNAISNVDLADMNYEEFQEWVRAQPQEVRKTIQALIAQGQIDLVDDRKLMGKDMKGNPVRLTRTGQSVSRGITAQAESYDKDYQTAMGKAWGYESQLRKFDEQGLEMDAESLNVPYDRNLRFLEMERNGRERERGRNRSMFSARGVSFEGSATEAEMDLRELAAGQLEISTLQERLADAVTAYQAALKQHPGQPRGDFEAKIKEFNEALQDAIQRRADVIQRFLSTPLDEEGQYTRRLQIEQTNQSLAMARRRHRPQQTIEVWQDFLQSRVQNTQSELAKVTGQRVAGQQRLELLQDQAGRKDLTAAERQANLDMQKMARENIDEAKKLELQKLAVLEKEKAAAETFEKRLKLYTAVTDAQRTFFESGIKALMTKNPGEHLGEAAKGLSDSLENEVIGRIGEMYTKATSGRFLKMLGIPTEASPIEDNTVHLGENTRAMIALKTSIDLLAGRIPAAMPKASDLAGDLPITTLNPVGQQNLNVPPAAPVKAAPNGMVAAAEAVKGNAASVAGVAATGAVAAAVVGKDDPRVQARAKQLVKSGKAKDHKAALNQAQYEVSQNDARAAQDPREVRIEHRAKQLVRGGKFDPKAAMNQARYEVAANDAAAAAHARGSERTRHQAAELNILPRSDGKMLAPDGTVLPQSVPGAPWQSPLMNWAITPQPQVVQIATAQTSVAPPPITTAPATGAPAAPAGNTPMTAATTATQTAQVAQKSGWAAMNGGQKAMGFAGGIMGAFGIYEQARDPNVSKPQALIGGALSGASIGAQFGPQGAAIGAIAGTVVSLFGLAKKRHQTEEKIFEQMPKRSDLSWAVPGFTPFSAAVAGRGMMVTVNVSGGSAGNLSPAQLQNAVTEGITSALRQQISRGVIGAGS